MSLKEIISQAKQQTSPDILVEVEVDSAAQALVAAQAGADIIMLDNMSPKVMRRIRSQIPHQVKLEASGGITLDNIREVALTGVDFISVGALTHSLQALDISLELEPIALPQP
jgi:nicotinate-nucleotide pyrophosphorylase (carboxylating)